MRIRISLYLTLFLLIAGGPACSTGELEPFSDAGHEEPDTQQEPDAQIEEPDADAPQIPPATTTTIHQLCAAAGKSNNDEYHSIHCFGPHDLTGFDGTFEAQNSTHRWRPGAFQIVGE